MEYKITKKFPDFSPPHTRLSNIIINGIKTKYYIRSDGVVFSSNHMKKGKLKKRKISVDKRTGYSLIHLSVMNKSYTKLVHRLVAEAFIVNTFNKPEVNHKDGDKTNNNYWNLEWVTEKENIEHAYRTGLSKVLYGENSNNPSITEKQARKICKYLEENKLTCKEIAKKVGCTKSIVSSIKEKRSWTTISCYYNIDNYNIRESVNGKLRMTEDIALSICKMIESGKYTIRDISNYFNIPYSRVNDIKQRKTWKAVSKKFDFSKYKSKLNI